MGNCIICSVETSLTSDIDNKFYCMRHIPSKMILPLRKAPWTDVEGNPIYEGDTLVHPSGEHGVVVCQEGESLYDIWRVEYGEGDVGRLCLQVGFKGCAKVIPRKGIHVDEII